MIKSCIMIIKYSSSGLKSNSLTKRRLGLRAKSTSSKKAYRKIETFTNNSHLSLILKSLNYKIVFFNNKIKFKCTFNKLNNKIKIFAYSSKI